MYLSIFLICFAFFVGLNIGEVKGLRRAKKIFKRTLQGK